MKGKTMTEDDTQSIDSEVGPLGLPGPISQIAFNLLSQTPYCQRPGYVDQLRMAVFGSETKRDYSRAHWLFLATVISRTDKRGPSSPLLMLMYAFERMAMGEEWPVSLHSISNEAVRAAAYRAGKVWLKVEWEQDRMSEAHSAARKAAMKELDRQKRDLLDILAGAPLAHV